MDRYQVCGSILESALPLPELIPAGEGEREFSLTVSASFHSAGYVWFRHWNNPEGRIWLSFGKSSASYALRFPGMADFELRDSCRDICLSSESGTPPETIRHLLLDVVIPLALSAQGKVVLHASAVDLPEGAFLFLGSSGQGKSTLASAFVQADIPVLSDDAVLLEEEEGAVFALPSYPSLRLWEDMARSLFGAKRIHPKVAHYTNKKRIRLPFQSCALASRRVAASKAFVLRFPSSQEDSEVRIAPLSTQQACLELIRHTYCLDPSDREMLGRYFDEAGRMATRIPFYELIYPRQTKFLPWVRRTILGQG